MSHLALPTFLIFAVTTSSTIADFRHFSIKINSNSRLDSNSAGQVYINSPNDGQYQVWSWNVDHTIRNVATGLCLDSQGYSSSSVITTTCNAASRSQQWFGGPNMGQLFNAATIWCLHVDTNYATKVVTTCCGVGGTVYQTWGL
ncbi:Actinohivin [Folsomia candida]|uniref:Actinohivin n=1 Tax=Folsomia candida TaxID=158441 RepID=A0A226D1T3_FOLCA|nr:Actinohivin [Folsomia candida]